MLEVIAFNNSFKKTDSKMQFVSSLSTVNFFFYPIDSDSLTKFLYARGFHPFRG